VVAHGSRHRRGYRLGIFTVIGTAEFPAEQFDTSSMVNTPLASYIITHTALAGPARRRTGHCDFDDPGGLRLRAHGLCYAELASMDSDCRLGLHLHLRNPRPN